MASMIGDVTLGGVIKEGWLQKRGTAEKVSTLIILFNICGRCSQSGGTRRVNPATSIHTQA